MFSIILPAFNCSETISRCINSVLQQNYTCYELIIVNDGSTDNTELIIDSFLPNPKIVLISQDNSGPAVARNRGLSVAQGDIILFLDSDDYLAPNALSSLNSVSDYAPDSIIIFSYKMVFSSENAVVVKIPTICSSTQYFKYLYLGKIRNFVWNIAFSRNLFSDYSITFKSDISLLEDAILLNSIFKHVRSISCYNNRPLYSYCLHSGSLSNGISLSQIDSGLDAIDYFLSFPFSPDISNKYISNYLFDFFFYLYNSFLKLGINDTRRRSRFIYLFYSIYTRHGFPFKLKNLIKYALFRRGLYAFFYNHKAR